jgi:multiple sugar transport system ATP-binding protein
VLWVVGSRLTGPAQIALENLTKVYQNSFEAIRDLDLYVADGEFLVLVGPLGRGKTRALRIVAGLEDITHGTLRIGGRAVDVSPKDRAIAMVFQNYALYPHMTVAENIGFALELRKISKAEIRKKVMETAAILVLKEWIDGSPASFSGGQRQRSLWVGYRHCFRGTRARAEQLGFANLENSSVLEKRTAEYWR